MIFCPNCGMKVDEKYNFCFSCGANLEEVKIRLQEGEYTGKTHEIYKPEELEFESLPANHIDRPMRKQSWTTSVGTFLSKTHQILKYLTTMRKRRLYKQWVAAANLPPDAIPEDILAESMMLETGWQQVKLVLIYVLLGVSILILFTGLILVIINSC